jgi:hypothetical protein
VKRLPFCLALLLVLGLATTAHAQRGFFRLFIKPPPIKPPFEVIRPPMQFELPGGRIPPIHPEFPGGRLPLPAERPWVSPMPPVGVRVPLPILPETVPGVGMAGKTVGSVPLAPANLGGRPRLELESLGASLKVPEAAALSPPARGLLRILESSLMATDGGLLAESKLKAGDLPKALVEHLPEPLRAQFKCVRGLQNIDIELSKPGGQADPNVLTGALKDVHRANPKLAAKVKAAAAAAAERKGQPQLAGQLRNIELVAAVPPDGPPILGGVADLPPPHGPGTSQAVQQEPLFKGLEELGPEVSAEAKAAARKLNRDMERWADFRYTMGYSYYQLARLAYDRDKDRENPQLAVRRKQQRQQCLPQVAGALGRKLRPSERLLVADMLVQGYTNEQIVAELKAIDEDRP